MATHSNILVWEVTWTKEPGWLQFMGLQSQTLLSGRARTQGFMKPRKKLVALAITPAWAALVVFLNMWFKKKKSPLITSSVNCLQCPALTGPPAVWCFLPSRATGLSSLLQKDLAAVSCPRLGTLAPGPWETCRLITLHCGFSWVCPPLWKISVVHLVYLWIFQPSIFVRFACHNHTSPEFN